MNATSPPSTLVAVTIHRPKIHFQSTASLLKGCLYPPPRAWPAQIPRRVVFKPSKNACLERRRRRSLSSCYRRRRRPLLLKSRCRSFYPPFHTYAPLSHLYVDLSADAFCAQFHTVYVLPVETASKKSPAPFTSSSVATSTAVIA